MKNINAVCCKTTLFVICLFFCCCAGKETGNKNTADTLITANRDTTATTDSDEVNTATWVEPDPYPEIHFEAKNISKTAFEKSISIKGDFSPLAALKLLFPGRYYSFADPLHNKDSVRLEAWGCADCAVQPYHGVFDGDLEQFPRSSGNITQYADTVYFTEKGVRNVLLSFSTTDLTDPEMMGTGRFSCAILGLALFTEQNGAWVLKNFSPALGCFGSFQTLPEIHLLKFGAQRHGCYLTNSNGGAGGPYYSDLAAFGLVNGKFKEVLWAIGVRRFNTGISEWDMTIGGGQTACDTCYGSLQLVLSGNFNRKSYTENEDTISNVPDELAKMVQTRDSFDFKIVREYIFEGGAYRLKASKVE